MPRSTAKVSLLVVLALQGLGAGRVHDHLVTGRALFGEVVDDAPVVASSSAVGGVVGIAVIDVEHVVAPATMQDIGVSVLVISVNSVATAAAEYFVVYPVARFLVEQVTIVGAVTGLRAARLRYRHRDASGHHEE
jgi:hypothetical protein